MIEEQAYIKVCEGYKKGKPIDKLIKEHIYTLDPDEEYPSLNFDMWLCWACRESHDDESNPVLILCMAEFIKKQCNEVYRRDSLNESTLPAFAVIDAINWFALDGHHPPTGLLGSAVRYLFNNESVNTIIADALPPIDMSMISQLPDCGVEYYSRHELKEFFINEERKYLEQCGINPECPF